MKRIICTVLVLTTFWAVGLSQEDGLKSDVGKVQAITDVVPVTCTEANTVFQRIEDAMAKLFPVVHGGPPGVVEGENALTREQVINEFDRISKLYESQYSLKPREQYCDASAVKFPRKERSEAIKLIKLGYVEPVAVLACGPKDTLSVEDFSEALGFFVERWADMTHMPSIKFSPALTPDVAKPAPIAKPTPPSGSQGQAPSNVSLRPTLK